MTILELVSLRRDLWEVADAMRRWNESLYRHSVAVADLAVAVVLKMGFSKADAEVVRLGGFLHDLGKVSWPKSLAAKAVLDDEDWRVIHVHPLQGAMLAEELVKDVPQAVLRIIREHHERNGRGYPCRLRNEVLDPLSRVVAAVESFVALTEERPYRLRSFAPEEAIEIVREDGFDEEVVKVLERLVIRKSAVAKRCLRF